MRQRRRITVAAPSVVAPDAPTLTAPADNADVYDGVAVTVSATVTAGQVPDRIDWVLDPGGGEVVVATDSTSAYSQTWTPSGVSAGAHTLVARFVYGSGSVDSAAVDITVWSSDLLSPLTDAGWTQELKLSARTATQLTEDSDTGFHGVQQTVPGAPNSAMHYRIEIPAASGNGRYVGIAVDGGSDQILIDAQAGSILSADPGILNESYAADVLSFDYTHGAPGLLFVGTCNGAAIAYLGTSTRTATFGAITAYST